ncbi:hypothetical protein BgiMline_008462 [Biomphalaria glabrata]|nr:hypothetical protein BgiBS90_033975 [Biomphalaria glabrata]KAI8747564.1 hypothetical protein BgiMline_019282 [Biomphalaria glabrata]
MKVFCHHWRCDFTSQAFHEEIRIRNKRENLALFLEIDISTIGELNTMTIIDIMNGLLNVVKYGVIRSIGENEAL